MPFISERVPSISRVILRQAFAFAALFSCTAILLTAQTNTEPVKHSQLTLTADDVLATGNEWMALPEIRAVDGALMDFNVLSMSHRGLLQVNGVTAEPVIAPYFTVDGKPLALKNPQWQLIEYWTPTATQTTDGIEATLTWCAPPGSHGAFVRLTLTNQRSTSADVALGVHASFGSLMRVTYVPVELSGTRSVSAAAWVSPGSTFSYTTNDTDFAWSIIHPGSTSEMNSPPTTPAPALTTTRKATLAPGQTLEANFILGAGIEEFSSSHAARALMELLDRDGAEALINQTAEWCRQRTRKVNDPALDLLMNRNYLFTRLYAWGRTIDTEQLVGITSRSPRYYVSAAYWDRDAMLWSFPGLLDTDPDFAREALDYALTIQLRNTGTHSRFIDGVVLEDGFQLDEAAAPVVALGSYLQKTGDVEFLRDHKKAIEFLRKRLLSRYDAATGLFSSQQDPQDEFQRLSFITVDNAIVWHALNDLAEIDSKLDDATSTSDMRRRATELHAAILTHAVAVPPAGKEKILASATSGRSDAGAVNSMLGGNGHDEESGEAPGQNFVFTDMPPNSLMKLPSLGFISEDDPLFIHTYEWLHSPAYKYSFSNEPYGLPGSYRLLFTASWPIADHLTLKLGREKALKILHAAKWDAGIITEGVHANDAEIDQQGRGFATAAGYMAHAICQMACTDKP